MQNSGTVNATCNKPTLTIPKIADRIGISREQMHRLYKQGLFNFPRLAGYHRRRPHFADTPALRKWCKEQRQVRSGERQKQHPSVLWDRFLDYWAEFLSATRKLLDSGVIDDFDMSMAVLAFTGAPRFLAEMRLKKALRKIIRKDGTIGPFAQAYLAAKADSEREEATLASLPAHERTSGDLRYPYIMPTSKARKTNLIGDSRKRHNLS